MSLDDLYQASCWIDYRMNWTKQMVHWLQKMFDPCSIPKRIYGSISLVFLSEIWETFFHWTWHDFMNSANNLVGVHACRGEGWGVVKHCTAFLRTGNWMLHEYTIIKMITDIGLIGLEMPTVFVVWLHLYGTLHSQVHWGWTKKKWDDVCTGCT